MAMTVDTVMLSDYIQINYTHHWWCNDHRIL